MSEDTRTPKAPRIKVTCPCGVVFEVLASKIARGDGKYCSRDCFYQSRRSRRSEYVTVVCACGREFETLATRIAKGRGKFCSKKCRHRFGTRKSGLTYDIKVVNTGWFPSKPEFERQTPEEKAAYKREWKRNNPDKVKAQWVRRLPRQKIDWLRRAHGMTPDDLRRLFKAQGGRCYLFARMYCLRT